MSDSDGPTIREEAYRAAAAVVDRFLGRIGEDSVETTKAAGTATRDRFRAELGRVVDLNLDMVRNAFGMYSGLLDPKNFGPAKTDTLELGPTLADTTATTVLWLHNFDDVPIEDVGFVGSTLSVSDSESPTRMRWWFDPSEIAVPPRSAVPILVGVEVPDDTLPGIYRGTVSPSGREGQSVGVLLEVVAADSVGHETW